MVFWGWYAHYFFQNLLFTGVMELKNETTEANCTKENNRKNINNTTPKKYRCWVFESKVKCILRATHSTCVKKKILMVPSIFMNAFGIGSEFLMSIVTRSAITCCTFWRWIMVGTYCWQNQPTIWMIFLTYHRNTHMPVPQKIGRLSTWRLCNVSVTGISFLMKKFDFVSVSITSHIFFWSHGIKIGY